MTDWTNDERARRIEYISGLDRETLERLGGIGDCVTHHYCDCTAERIKKLVAECDRLLSANDTLVERINDLTEGYALEDTCPRVQCQTTSQRLHRELAVAREHCIEQGKRIEELQDERDGLRNGNRDLHEECQRLRRERDNERESSMNDWRTRALEYEAVIWKAYWECDGYFDTWLLENMPDTHARIQNAVKP